MAAVPSTYNLRDICLMWGRSERWFRRHRQDLEQSGFPKPVSIPNLRRPTLTYLRSEIDAYFARRGGPDHEAQSRDVLNRKYGSGQ